MFLSLRFRSCKVVVLLMYGAGDACSDVVLKMVGIALTILFGYPPPWTWLSRNTHTRNNIIVFRLRSNDESCMRHHMTLECTHKATLIIKSIMGTTHVFESGLSRYHGFESSMNINIRVTWMGLDHMGQCNSFTWPLTSNTTCWWYPLELTNVIKNVRHGQLNAFNTFYWIPRNYS